MIYKGHMLSKDVTLKILKVIGLSLVALVIAGWEIILLLLFLSILWGGDDYWLIIFISLTILLYIGICIMVYIYWDDTDIPIATRYCKRTKQRNSFWKIPSKHRYTSGGMGWKLRKYNPTDWRIGREGDLFKRTGRRRKW